MSTVTITASPAPLTTVPATAAPRVSFIAVTYGTGPIIVDSIRTLTESLAGLDLAYEYIVVDNLHPVAPHRARHELLLSTAGVTVVKPGRNLGFGGGCELGALHATGEVLALVNPDVIFRPGWIEPLLAVVADHSIVAPVLRDPDGTVQEAGQVLRPDGSTRSVTTQPVATGTNGADYPSAACWLIRRDEHERIGGFDPVFHPAYYEDVDLVLRALDLGGSWAVVPDATVVHHRGGSTTERTVPDTRQARTTLLTRRPSLRWTQADCK
jgi:O-antigen biosynthesis protein